MNSQLDTSKQKCSSKDLITETLAQFVVQYRLSPTSRSVIQTDIWAMNSLTEILCQEIDRAVQEERERCLECVNSLTVADEDKWNGCGAHNGPMECCRNKTIQEIRNKIERGMTE